MDVQMPEMDGLEATRRIRQEFPGQIQPSIIAMTANAMKADRDNCLAAGMDGYLSKPIQIQELVNTLKTCSGHKHPNQPSVEVSNHDTQDKTIEALIPILEQAGLNRLIRSLGKQSVPMFPVFLVDFYTDTENLLRQAQAAVQEGKLDELRRAAHTLKSNSATFGAMSMSTVARQLEHLARDGSQVGAADLLIQLQIEFEQAKAALEDVRVAMQAKTQA